MSIAAVRYRAINHIHFIDYIYKRPFAQEADYARWLNLGEGTISNKLGALYTKMGVHSKHELLAELKRLGHRPRAVTLPDDDQAA